jgi:hypothetical protein
MKSNSSDRLVELLGQVKALGQEYHELTGKPLGVTGAIAEFEAARLLGVELCGPQQKGYNAVRTTDHAHSKLQIVGRCFPPEVEARQRIAKIELEKEWDAVLMVLLTPELEAREIWEADRAALIALLGSGQRTDPSVKKFKQIGRKAWPVA